jgi:hypothetical protein
VVDSIGSRAIVTALPIHCEKAAPNDIEKRQQALDVSQAVLPVPAPDPNASTLNLERD